MDTNDTAWCNLNPIGAKARLDHVPEQPGLYKLTFKLWGTTYSYIGETGNLQERIRTYVHNPTKGNHMEYLMLDLLTEAGGAELSICYLGLESKKEREGYEKTAITEARRQGPACIINRGGPIDIRMQIFRLKSEERMLVIAMERVRAKLVKLEATPSNYAM
jgi:hypothetical protein